MKTILVTGTSSGFGLNIARHFLDRGWHVFATMREPREGLLPPSDRLRILPLDVRDPASIDRVAEAAGTVDVLVNNAGIGMLGALEGTPQETVRDVFETNTLGPIALTRAILPRFRAQRSGVIVNISSSVTLIPLKFLSVYSASKAALNAFGASLALELEPFGVSVRTILPGQAPETRFGENARERMKNSFPRPYAEAGQRLFEEMDHSAQITESKDVVDAVWRAATDPSAPTNVPAGTDATAMAATT
jgi:NAD(P)-dependent dehydrogenase (short-subunit alcohol dehydrogenase family)